MRKKRFSGEEDDGAVPDHLRCRRSDGRHWRCARRAMATGSVCEYHYRLSRRNLDKNNPKASHLDSELRNPDRSSDPLAKRRRWRGLLDSSAEELIRMAIERQMERREERRKRREREMEVKRILPNGVMAISSDSVGVSSNAAPIVDRKIGLDAACFLRRCFRSKNVDPVPVGTIKKCFPNARVLGKGEKRVPNRCGESKVARFVRKRCIRCVLGKDEDSEFKACFLGDPSASKPLPPMLKELSQEHTSELEIEANNQGRRVPGVQLQLAEYRVYRHDEHSDCNYCKNSIDDIHRSCSKCSYKLCLSCFQEIHHGGWPERVAIDTSKYLTRKKTYQLAGNPPEGVRRKLPSKLNTLTVPGGKTNKKDGNISCPLSEHGGCGDGILIMKFFLPFCWTQKSDTISDQIARAYERLHKFRMKTLNTSRSAKTNGSTQYFKCTAGDIYKT